MALYEVYINKYTYLLSIFDNNIINFIISNFEEKYNIYRHLNILTWILERVDPLHYIWYQCAYI